MGYSFCSRSRSSLGARLAIGRVQGSLKQHNRQRQSQNPRQGRNFILAMLFLVMTVLSEIVGYLDNSSMAALRTAARSLLGPCQDYFSLWRERCRMRLSDQRTIDRLSYWGLTEIEDRVRAYVHSFRRWRRDHALFAIESYVYYFRLRNDRYVSWGDCEAESAQMLSHIADNSCRANLIHTFESSFGSMSLP